jgi:hypothetical protein
MRYSLSKSCCALAVATAALALAAPPTGATAARQAAVPERANVATPLPAQATRVLRARFLDEPPAGSWRLFRAGAISVAVSSSYASPETTAQHWGDFLARLVHGDEMERLTLYLGTPDDVNEICGGLALGCYAPGWNRIVSVGETTDDVRPEAVVTHEYGHYIAANRENPPWDALDWGTKRWATTLNVCARARTRKVFPGAEDTRYFLNPGEGFAETYRFLNGQPTADLGLDWPIVDRLFYPDARSLQAVRRDVLQPWTHPTSLQLTGRLDSRGSARVTVSTPLDGNLELAASGATIAGSVSAHREICGTRHIPVQLAGKPRSAFVLNVTRP